MKEKLKFRYKILCGLVFIVGLSIFLYPTMSNWYLNMQYQEVVDSQSSIISGLSDEELEEEWEKAVDYNNNLVGTPVKDPFVAGSGSALPDNYIEVLNVSDNGVMGSIEIPSVDIKLPIYHGSSNDVLEKGIGHLEGFSLPIGSDTGHTLLTGHTGLPSAKLFTDLEKIKIGDKFYINVLNKQLVYKVDEITVIEPEELRDLKIEEGKDYVTLITCTPYGINSHRLLVRGERVYEVDLSITIQQQDMVIVYYAVIAVVIVVSLLILLWNLISEKNDLKKLMKEE